VTSRAPPLTTAMTPAAATSLDIRLKRFTIPPYRWTAGGGARWPRPLAVPKTAFNCFLRYRTADAACVAYSVALLAPPIVALVTPWALL
jgi:hypothetical protein